MRLSPTRDEWDITAPSTNAAKQWDGWGTALKPAHEPIVVARKPLIGTVIQNVQEHGTGALNIDGCRIDSGPSAGGSTSGGSALGQGSGWNAHENRAMAIDRSMNIGRWPANVIHDGSDEVLEGFPVTSSGTFSGIRHARKSKNVYGDFEGITEAAFEGSTGSTGRFFYCAKVARSERGDNNHPTVKPVALMRYLVRLVTPPDGIVLDPFAGSGSTVIAAHAEGMTCIAIEQSPDYCRLIMGRLYSEDRTLF